MNRISILGVLVLSAPLATQNPPAIGRLPLVEDVDAQPLVAATKRLTQALASIGARLPKADEERLTRAMSSSDTVAVRTIQEVLDRYCLLGVHINPESRVKVAEGPADKKLVQRDWRSFLVKVHNEAGVTAPLEVTSPNAGPLYKRSTGSPEPAAAITKSDTRERFLDLVVYRRPPLRPRLSGLELEYVIVQIASRDAGKREAKFACNVGQGTQDIGFRNEVSILFDSAPAVEVEIDVKDTNGQPVMGAFEFRDTHGRVYPAPSRRLAPDFFFQPQVYRKTGEHVLLPPGKYTVRYGRGPEYRTKVKSIEVPNTRRHSEEFVLERWVNPAARGWWSGDHHIHAAGCAHYESPTQGVEPADMMRHVLGEDLNVGCVLSWGPCWYYQKQFFEGKTNALSTATHLMRYDVEVSGFPSSHCGHLTLLRLTEDDYPGTDRIEQWPTFDLPILKWAKQQGGVVGFAHSGFGLQVPGRELPNYRVPPFNGIGANEYIVDVTHDAVDFISTVDTPAPWELNIWYHTLNCGYRTRISGETDFPCIYGQKVGLGRAYVKLDGKLDFDAWVAGVRDGRSYVSDGASHLMDFTVAGLGVGDRRDGGAASELRLAAPANVKVTATVACLLGPKPRPEIAGRPMDRKPYWSLERARIGNTNRVPVELVVNGRSVAKQEVVADGTAADVSFDTRIERSSWVALRIFPSSHTNPVFVVVGDAPIRASRRSAKWCLESVDRCWESKVGRISAKDRPAAERAYEHARRAYRKILNECKID